jgi:hypothetical protein
MDLLYLEIFARYGKKFRYSKMTKYFSKFKWYKKNNEFDFNLLNSKEQNLVVKILNYQNSKNCHNKTGKKQNIHFLNNQSKVEFSKYGPYNSIYPTITNFNYFYNNSKQILISQKITHRQIGASNFPHGWGLIQTKAFLINNGIVSKFLWELKTRGVKGIINNYNFYKTSYLGCCGALNLYKLFNLKTGKLLLKYSGEILNISIPSSKCPQNDCRKRIIGYLGEGVIGEEPIRNILGTITYTSPKRALDKIIIIIKPNKKNRKYIGIRNPKIFFGPKTLSNIKAIHYNDSIPLQKRKDIILWHLNEIKNPTMIKGFDIKFDLGIEIGTLIIPIEGDKFSIKKIKNKYITLERASLE